MGKKISGWEYKTLNSVGELNRELIFRDDLDFYKRGLFTAKNCIVNLEGGIQNAPKLELVSESNGFIGITKESKARHFEYVLTTSESEYDSVLVTFVKNRVHLSAFEEDSSSFFFKLTLNTTYTEEELKILDIVQLESAILITCKGKVPSMININETAIEDSFSSDFWNSITLKPTSRTETDFITAHNGDIRMWRNKEDSLLYIMWEGDLFTPDFRTLINHNGILNLYGGKFKITLGTKGTRNLMKLQELKTMAIYVEEKEFSEEVYSALTKVDKLDLSFETSIFGKDFDKYPSKCTKFQNRLVLADIEGKRNCIAISKSGDFLNFGTGLDDGDGSVIYIPDERVDNIKSLIAYGSLIAITDYGLWSTELNTAFTPSSGQMFLQINAKPSNGINTKLDGSLYYCNSFSTGVNKLEFQQDGFSYTSSDISLLSRHLFANEIEKLSDIKIEDRIFLVAKTIYEGKKTLMLCALDESQNLRGWTRYDANEDFEIIKIQNKYFFINTKLEGIEISEFSTINFRKDMEIKLLPPSRSEEIKSDIPMSVKDYTVDQIVVTVIGNNYSFYMNDTLVEAPYGSSIDPNKIHIIKDIELFADEETGIVFKSNNEEKLKILSIYYKISTEVE